MGLWQKLLGKSGQQKQQSDEPAPGSFEDRADIVGRGVTEVATNLARDLVRDSYAQVGTDDVLAECILALLSFVDKQAFHVLGPRGRDKVMGRVRVKAFGAVMFIRFDNDEMGTFRQFALIECLGARYNERMQEYGPLALVAPENEHGGNDLDNCVGYALGKRIAPDGEKAAMLLSMAYFDCIESIQVQYGLRELLDSLNR